MNIQSLIWFHFRFFRLFSIIFTIITTSAYSAVVQCQYQTDGTCKIVGITPVLAPFEAITVAGQAVNYVEPKTLQLYFVNNFIIKFIPTNIFTIFPSLISIQITNCSTSMLTTDAFMNCNNLINIQVEYGNILYFPEGFAQRCSKVRGLSLIYNNIQVIDKNAFRGLSILQNADLRGNRLTCVAPEVFLNTPLIQQIYLQNNLIRTVDNLLLRNLQELRQLDIGNNLLSYIPLLDLTGTSLRSGTLGVAYNGNPIRAIKSDLCTMFNTRPTNITDNYWLLNFTCQPSLLSYTATTKLNCQTMNANFQTCFAGWTAAMAVNTPCEPGPVCIPSTIWGKVLGLLQYFAF